MRVVRVTDRTCKAMLSGAEFTRWPAGDALPDAHDRVIVFDRNLDFTQHFVVRVEGLRVLLGPAIPFRAEVATA